MNNNYTVFLILAVLIIVFLWVSQKKNNEYIDINTDNITAKNITASGNISTSANLDAIGNISTKNNLIVAGNINSSGSISTAGNISTGGEGSTFGVGGKNQWMLYTPLGVGRTQMYFAPRKADNSDWDWGGSTSFEKNGNVNFSGVLTAKKFVSADGSSSGPLSNEAIQSIASVYNKDNFTATNITATNNLSAVGNIGANGNLDAIGNISANGNISTNANLDAIGNIETKNNLKVKGNANVLANVYVGNYLCFDDVCINKADLNYIKTQVNKIR